MADETVRVIADKEDIVAIADAIRSKTGSTDEMTLDGIVNGINSIETGGGGSVETCTVTISSIYTVPMVYTDENGVTVYLNTKTPSIVVPRFSMIAVFIGYTDSIQANGGEFIYNNLTDSGRVYFIGNFSTNATITITAGDM